MKMATEFSQVRSPKLRTTLSTNSSFTFMTHAGTEHIYFSYIYSQAIPKFSHKFQLPKAPKWKYYRQIRTDATVA